MNPELPIGSDLPTFHLLIGFQRPELNLTWENLSEIQLNLAIQYAVAGGLLRTIAASYIVTAAHYTQATSTVT